VDKGNLSLSVCRLQDSDEAMATANRQGLRVKSADGFS
jgi:hypothetical protein